MKIAITGHKHGLGEALYDKLTIYNQNKNNQVIGFDIENGFDIGNHATQGKILYQCKDVDIFINNAYHQTGQTELLKKLLELWKHKNKIIVHIGTYLVYYETKNEDLEIHKSYIADKKYQKLLIDQHRANDQSLKVMQINPGLMETQFLDTMQVPKVTNLQNTLDCADVILYNIQMLSKGIYVKEITLDNI